MRKINNIVEFYKTTLMVNFSFSLLGLFSGSFNGFLFMLATIGFLFSIFFKERYRKNEYLFYSNNGISKNRLIFFGFLLNFFVVLILALVVEFILKLF